MESAGSENTPLAKSVVSSSESVAVSSSAPVWREVGPKQCAGGGGVRGPAAGRAGIPGVAGIMGLYQQHQLFLEDVSYFFACKRVIYFGCFFSCFPSVVSLSW